MKVLLGMTKSKVKIFEESQDYIVKHNTRCAITPTLIIPNLLTYEGNMIVEDIKGEAFEITVEYRRDLLKQNIYRVKYGEKLPETYKTPFTIYIDIQPGKDPRELIESRIEPIFSEILKRVDCKDTLLIAREGFLKGNRLEEGQNMIFVTEDSINQERKTIYLDWTEEEQILNGKKIEKCYWYKEVNLLYQ